MTEIEDAPNPFVRYSELSFSPEEFQAFQAKIIEVRELALDLAAVERLRQREWSFGEEGNKAVEEFFIPYVPKEGIAELVSDDAWIKGELTVNTYGRIKNIKLHALHMDKPFGVLSATAEIIHEDEDGEVERYVAAIINTGLQKQRVGALVMSKYQAEQEDRSGYYLENLLADQLRASTS